MVKVVKGLTCSSEVSRNIRKVVKVVGKQLCSSEVSRNIRKVVKVVKGLTIGLKRLTG